MIRASSTKICSTMCWKSKLLWKRQNPSSKTSSRSLQKLQNLPRLEGQRKDAWIPIAKTYLTCLLLVCKLALKWPWCRLNWLLWQLSWLSSKPKNLRWGGLGTERKFALSVKRTWIRHPWLPRALSRKRFSSSAKKSIPSLRGFSPRCLAANVSLKLLTSSAMRRALYFRALGNQDSLQLKLIRWLSCRTSPSSLRLTSFRLQSSLKRRATLSPTR